MKPVKATTSEDLSHEMSSELRTLRYLVRDTAEGFILRKEGEIETLLANLLVLPPAKLRAVATPWLRKLRDLKLKPAKGRLKDLKKIDELLHELLNYLIEAEGVAEGRKAPSGGKEHKQPVGRKSRPKGPVHEKE